MDNEHEVSCGSETSITGFDSGGYDLSDQFSVLGSTIADIDGQILVMLAFGLRQGSMLLKGMLEIRKWKTHLNFHKYPTAHDQRRRPCK